MSNRWLSSGRYEITHGLFKRLWDPHAELSSTIVPSLVPRRRGGGPGEENYLASESGEEVRTEEDQRILVN